MIKSKIRKNTERSALFVIIFYTELLEHKYI